MFGRRKNNVVELPSDIAEAEGQVILNHLETKSQYAADLSALIKFVTETPVEFAGNTEYAVPSGVKAPFGHGYHTYLTLVFADRAVTLKMYYSGLGGSDRNNSSIKVYRKEYSPQLDLFKHVEKFPLIGSISCKDVSPEHYATLYKFMELTVNAAIYERKKQSINQVLEIFE